MKQKFSQFSVDNMEAATAMADDESADSPGESGPPLEATWTIVLENVGLIHRVIRDHCPYRRDRDDLVQEGLLGLLEAARRFDPSRQVAFGTYAYYYIRGRILAVLRSESEFAPILPTYSNGDSEGDELQSGQPTLEPHEEEYIRNDLARDLKEHLVSDLDEIERLVVVLHWLSPEPSTLDSIAKALGLRSRSSVLEVERIALSKLRQAMSRRRR